MVHILIEKEKITEFIKYVRTLKGKFEEVTPFDFQAFMSSIVNFSLKSCRFQGK